MEKLYNKSMSRILLFTLIFFFILVFLMSMFKNQRNHSNEFIGAWSYCEVDSAYAECYILNDSSLCFFNLYEGEVYRKYKISSDTFFIYNYNLAELDKLYIKDKTPDQIILVDENNNKFIFYKIYEDIFLKKLLSKNIDEINIFSTEFRLRSKGICK